jgi:coproporphyrinogen III oxidase-like Fe-S oxidoreductase
MEFPPQAVASFDSVLAGCERDGLLAGAGTSVCLTPRGRLLSNEVFARFLREDGGKAKVREEVKVGTGHVNPR